MSVRSNADRKAAALESLRRQIPSLFGPQAKSELLNEIAAQGKDMLVDLTEQSISKPRWGLSGLAGQVRWGLTEGNTVDMAWRVGEVDVGAGTISWRNPNPIFKFLDEGTQAHGPVRAKKLFIPLNRETAKAYLDGSLAVVGGPTGMIMPTKSSRRALKGYTRRSGKEKTLYRKLVFGKDFILVDRVRGIQPRRIVEHFKQTFFPKCRSKFREWVLGQRMKVRDILQGMNA